MQSRIIGEKERTDFLRFDDSQNNTVLSLEELQPPTAEKKKSL